MNQTLRLGMMVLATAVLINDERKKKSDKVDEFILLSNDNTKSIFMYGHEKYAKDNEMEAFQKALNTAMAQGFTADEKSISMFANRKIERLILSK
ncbi:hypothetical protein [Sphingobium sp. HWE2-09]|uniref:hypothetical protein n=1 Tax=Sphingobium sp. HWE2-09 TaxID=3108390 RepID=UPI002DC37642|nr:hypothetical protein [Sphingobium sp. HWE2-09]